VTSLVQLTRSGLTIGDPERLAATREAFSHHHLVKLPDFVEPSLLDRLVARLEITPWELRTHTRDHAWSSALDATGERGDVWARDLQMQDAAILSSWMFLLNDPSLFDVVAQLTGCGALRSFIPNIYKIEPGAGHFDDWHTDADGERAVALSINVGRAPYEGGLLQIRKKGASAIVHEVWNAGFGDAMLMRIAPDLEHRLTPVTGRAPRVVVAGWFSPAAIDVLAARG
jgi:hypothetical protein